MKERKNVIDDDLTEYLNELTIPGPYEDLLERMSEEILLILFLNRSSLQRFNNMIALHINSKGLDELDDGDLIYFKKNGILKRVNIPVWVQRAVLHRDRGCVLAVAKM